MAAAKRATAADPVFITSRGRSAFVLLKIEDYNRLADQQGVRLLKLMNAVDGGSGIAFDASPLRMRSCTVDLG